jgi:hypothetical protein
VNPANNQKRFRLEFPTVSGIRYDVQFRPSLTSGGNNAKATVFVEASVESGFYAIGRGVAV